MRPSKSIKAPKANFIDDWSSAISSWQRKALINISKMNERRVKLANSLDLGVCRCSPPSIPLSISRVSKKRVCNRTPLIPPSTALELRAFFDASAHCVHVGGEHIFFLLSCRLISFRQAQRKSPLRLLSQAIKRFLCCGNIYPWKAPPHSLAARRVDRGGSGGAMMLRSTRHELLLYIRLLKAVWFMRRHIFYNAKCFELLKIAYANPFLLARTRLSKGQDDDDEI